MAEREGEAIALGSFCNFGWRRNINYRLSFFGEHYTRNPQAYSACADLVRFIDRDSATEPEMILVTT